MTHGVRPPGARPSCTTRIGLAACVFRGVEILTVARSCGFDFLLADMEHGAMSLGEVAALCAAGRGAGFPVHVRAPGPAADALSRIVDCGADALVVPHVDSAGAARAIVARVRFAPVGARSIPSPLVAAGFRPQPPAELIAAAEAAPEVLVMIESAGALAEAEAIAATPGIDGLIVGTNDLAAALGHVGAPEAAPVREAFARIAGVARAAGKGFGVMGLPEALLGSHARALGADWIVATNEINLLVEAGALCAARFRDAVTNERN